MILIWNSGAVQQLHQDGYSAFNWTGSVEPPAPAQDDLGGRRPSRVLLERDRIRREDDELLAMMPRIMEMLEGGEPSGEPIEISLTNNTRH